MLNKNCPRKRLTQRELRELDVEISFLEGIVRRIPNFLEAWHVLEADYAERGDLANGLRVEEQLVQLCPNDPIAYYNLACVYSLTRQLRRAADALNRAIDQGYQDFRRLAKDPDLANLRKHAVFKRVRAKIQEARILAH